MLTFDLEATNLDKGSPLNPENRIVMVAWQEDNGPVGHYYGPITYATSFWNAYTRHDEIIAYNAKYEIGWMLRLGSNVHAKMWHDPMLGELVLQGNRRPGFSMDAVARRYGYAGKDPVVDAMMKNGVCPSEIPQRMLIDRCRQDVRTTYHLHMAIRKLLRERGQLHLYRTRCDLAPILAEIEREGVYLDKFRVAAATVEVANQLRVAESQLNELTGGINLRSPKQLAELLYDKLGFPEKRDRNGKPIRNKPTKAFPDGAPKTDKATIAWLETQAQTPEQEKFVILQRQYAKLSAAMSKSLDFFYRVTVEKNSRFHAAFNQTVAATHRLTSSAHKITFSDGETKGCQLQNQPREYKRLFCAPDSDYYVVEVDAAQLEFRVAAFVGDDDVARADIADPDFDAHCKSASVMAGMDYEQFIQEYRQGKHKALRQAAKSETFKPLYGGKRGTPEQERWYAEFRTRYADLTRTQENWRAEVEQRGQLVLPWGMRFFWDVTYNRRGVPLDAKTKRPIEAQVCNYPVQSLATAEIVPLAIISLHKRCRERELDVKFVNTVHDSIICYVRKNQIDSFVEEAKQAFTTDVIARLRFQYGLDFDVPLGIEIKYGSHWGEGTEIVYDMEKG